MLRPETAETRPRNDFQIDKGALLDRVKLALGLPDKSDASLRKLLDDCNKRSTTQLSTAGFTNTELETLLGEIDPRLIYQMRSKKTKTLQLSELLLILMLEKLEGIEKSNTKS